VQELAGERIDIVPWHPDPEIFAKRALAPARVAKVVSDYDRRVMTAIVDEDQLSLAIGRNGQNVRLASQLIGWQIDLFSSREWLERGADEALFGGGGTSTRNTRRRTSRCASWSSPRRHWRRWKPPDILRFSM
jgi:transcription termination/antitermination protein NusA